MEIENHPSYFNLMSAETLPQSGYYFSSQHGNIKSPIFHCKKDGFEIFKKFCDENSLTPQIQLHLLHKLMSRKMCNILSEVDSDFYLDREDENEFILNITEYYSRVEGSIEFAAKEYHPMLKEGKNLSIKKVDLYFRDLSHTGDDVVTEIREFKSKEMFLQWISSSEAVNNISFDERKRLGKMIRNFAIEEFYDDEEKNYSFLPNVEG